MSRATMKATIAVMVCALIAVGCARDDSPSYAKDAAMGGSSPGDGTGGAVGSPDDVQADGGSSFGGAPTSGGSSFGGAIPALTLENLDIPATVELVEGELCWGVGEECEPIPTFDPPLVEWNPDRDDDQVIVRIPPGACALRIEVNDEGMCWIGPRRITRSADKVGPYVGFLTRTKPECAESWRLEIFAGDCVDLGAGGGQ